MTLDQYFNENDASRKIFDCLHQMIEAIGPLEMVVQKSQIAFRRNKAFAYAWIPGKYLRGRGAPLVLTLSLRRRDLSPRWKETVEPSPGRFIHHMELHSPGDLDDQVLAWLQEAWTHAD